MAYRIRLTEAAEADLQAIYTGISERASAVTARGYVNRIVGYLELFHVSWKPEKAPDS